MAPDDRARAVAERIALRFAAHEAVTAVALAGSRTAGAAGASGDASTAADDASDIDPYVYAEPELPLAARTAVAGDAPVRALGNTFFEPGDEWFDPNSGLEPWSPPRFSVSVGCASPELFEASKRPHRAAVLRRCSAPGTQAACGA